MARPLLGLGTYLISAASAWSQTVVAPLTPKTDKAAVFYSGHSLTDNPLPDHVALIASSLQKSHAWNQQNVIGSPIRVRVKGMNPQATGFPGYRTGKNRQGEGMDVVAELRQPKTIGAGAGYDALVITENHNLPLDPTYGENTVRYARHFHDRLIEGNPKATTYFYQSWQSFKDIHDPRPWIAFERAATPVWQCLVQRLNTSLAHEGRADRFQYLPAGPALATLVERATQGTLAGVTGDSVKATMQRLFVDDVHLTSMGAYYVALVTYAAIYKQSPVGAAAPPGVNSSQARALQDTAWDAAQAYYAQPSLPTLEHCSNYMQQSFCGLIWPYIGYPQHVAGCKATFAQKNEANPFWFGPERDRAYWYPAP